MNWLSKFDEVMTAFKDDAVMHWELVAALGLIGAAMAIILARRSPHRSHDLRRKARTLRYCHDCQFADLPGETCAIEADAAQKCGLIDSTAGMDWTIPTKL